MEKSEKSTVRNLKSWSPWPRFETMSYTVKSLNSRLKAIFYHASSAHDQKAAHSGCLTPFCYELSMRRQCEVLSISRSSYYYKPKPIETFA
jgi:hypothetical protein